MAKKVQRKAKASKGEGEDEREIVLDARLSREIGIVRRMFPVAWDARVKVVHRTWRENAPNGGKGDEGAPPPPHVPPKHYVLKDFGGQLGLETLSPVKRDPPAPPASPSTMDRRRRATENARRLHTILTYGEGRGIGNGEIARAIESLEAAMVHYQGFSGPDAKARRAARIAVLLEALAGEEGAAACAFEDCKGDPDGLARIPLNDWSSAFQQWKGVWRTRRPGRSADRYDWRDIVLDLLRHAYPGKRNRRGERAWLEDIAPKPEEIDRETAAWLIGTALWALHNPRNRAAAIGRAARARHEGKRRRLKKRTES